METINGDYTGLLLWCLLLLIIFFVLIICNKILLNGSKKSHLTPEKKKRKRSLDVLHDAESYKPEKRKQKTFLKKFNFDENSKLWQPKFEGAEGFCQQSTDLKAFPTSNEPSDNESLFTPDVSPSENESMDEDNFDDSIYMEFVKYTKHSQTYDIHQFFEIKKPKTPPIKTPMEHFDPDYLKSCIIYNLYRQRLDIKEDTIQKIMLFFKKPFYSKNSKINLQVLVHLSKVDALEIMPEGGSIDDEFDFTIAQYVDYAMEDVIDADAIITLASNKTTTLIKEALMSPRILTAFREALKSALGSSIYLTDEFLKKSIKDLKIYNSGYFPPLHHLRGACLLDGFLICKEHVVKIIGTNNRKHRADLISLSAHECGHYLGRKISGNFNISTPFFTLPNGGKKVMFEPVYHGNFLEMGRNVELIIFDGVQPDWLLISDHAADIFLNRLKDLNTLVPIIKKVEQNKMRLKGREFPSCASGIDFRIKRRSYY